MITIHGNESSFLIHSNIFLAISGTSTISLNIDPLMASIYGLYYTKTLQKILESIWEHPGKILSLHI